MTGTSIVPAGRIERMILLIRGQKVIVDVNLAALYGVETCILLQAVKRNTERFPSDFMFHLTTEEFEGLRSQFVISKARGGRRYEPTHGSQYQTTAAELHVEERRCRYT